MPNSIRVFASHSSRDKPIVRELLGQMPSWVRPWIDEAELRLGAPLEPQLESVIAKGVSFVLLFISEPAAESEWVKKEVVWASTREAAEGRVFVIPVLLPNSNQSAAALGMDAKLAYIVSGTGRRHIRLAAEEISHSIAQLVDEHVQFQSIITTIDESHERWLRYLFAIYIGLLVVATAGGPKPSRCLQFSVSSSTP